MDIFNKEKNINIITKEKQEVNLRADFKVEFRPPKDMEARHTLYMRTFGLLNIIQTFNKYQLSDEMEITTAIVYYNSSFEFWEFLKQYSYINNELAYYRGDLDDPDFMYSIYWGYVKWLNSHKVIESYNRIFKPVSENILWRLLDIMKGQKKRKVAKDAKFSDAYSELLKGIDNHG